MSEKIGHLPLLHTVVIAAAFTLLGTAIGGVIEGYWQTSLETRKFDASLINQALAPGSQEIAARNLLFLIDSGLITDLDIKKIRALAETPADLPTHWGNLWGSPWR